MQRLRKDRSFILAEVKGLVLKSTVAQSVEYMNEPHLHQERPRIAERSWCSEMQWNAVQCAMQCSLYGLSLLSLLSSTSTDAGAFLTTFAWWVDGFLEPPGSSDLDTIYIKDLKTQESRLFCFLDFNQALSFTWLPDASCFQILPDAVTSNRSKALDLTISHHISAFFPGWGPFDSFDQVVGCRPDIQPAQDSGFWPCLPHVQAEAEKNLLEQHVNKIQQDVQAIRRI